MKDGKLRYDDLKPVSKRLRQALFRFCIYGALLVAGEVAFYTITKIGRMLPLVSWLFQYDWEVDPVLKLGNVWKVPVMTLFGQASLYMFIVYGAICVVGLEPAYRFMKRKDIPVVLRGLVYMCIILFMECTLGWILKFATGYDIWIYYGPGTLFTYTSLAIAPMWFVCGLISENVINLIDSFDELKLNAYGFGERAAEQGGAKKDRIVVISDVHIGPRRADGGSDGWFYGVYEIYLTIMLHKISRDARVRELVFLGDLFDTWLYPPEEKPDSVSAIIGNWKDSPFMAPLRECIRKFDRVWYISGNHDMHVTQRDLDALSVDGKTMVLSTADDFNRNRASASGCAFHLEHGHAADFFNAPDDGEDTVQGMPFGYFVSRIVAAAEDFDIDATFRATYLKMAGMQLQAKKEESADHRAGRLFVKLFVDALVSYANSKREREDHIGDDTVVKMPGDNGDTTIREIKSKYSSLLAQWLDSRQTYFFAAAGKNGLDRYARKKFGEVRWDLWFRRIFSSGKPEMVVVMGHTHYGMVERVMNREKQGIYANTGCVCRNKKQAGAHWIEIRDSEKACSVRLRRL